MIEYKIIITADIPDIHGIVAPNYIIEHFECLIYNTENVVENSIKVKCKKKELIKEWHVLISFNIISKGILIKELIKEDYRRLIMLTTEQTGIDELTIKMQVWEGGEGVYFGRPRNS